MTLSIAPVKPAEFTFTRVSENPPGEYVTALVYGPSKTGKTWFFGTAGSRTLIVDTGAGLETLKSPLFKQKVGADPITISVEEKIGARGVVDEAIAFDIVCDIIDYALAKIPDDFDTIVIDDMTAMRRFALNKGLEINQEIGKSKSLSASKRLDAVIIAVQDYGIEMDLIMKFIVGTMSLARRAKKHLLFGAHEKHFYKQPRDSQGKTIMGEAPVIVKTYPAFTGKQYPDQIVSLFDEIWHTEKVGGGQNINYRLRTIGTAGDGGLGVATELIAGSRHGGVFPELVDHPNFLSMLAQIRAAYDQTKSIGEKK